MYIHHSGQQSQSSGVVEAAAAVNLTAVAGRNRTATHDFLCAALCPTFETKKNQSLLIYFILLEGGLLKHHL